MTENENENEIKKEMINWINKASYKDMLIRNRFSPSSDNIFQGEMGTHFFKVMNQKKNKLTNSEAVSISKNIGW